MDGAFFTPNETVPQVDPICSSGNCHWEPYGSLGICWDVVNITALGNETLLAGLTEEAATRLQSLLNNRLWADNSLVYRNLGLTTFPTAFPVVLGPMAAPSGVFNDSVTKLLVSDTYLAYSDVPMTNATINASPSFQFLEIGHFFCTKAYVTDVKDGIATTVEIASRSEPVNNIPYSLNFPWTPEILGCCLAQTCNKTFGGMELELEAPLLLQSPERYVVDVWTTIMSSFLAIESMYDTLLLDETRGIIISSGGGVSRAFATSLFGDWLETQSPPPPIQMQNVRGIAQNMVQSLTNL